MKTTTKFQLVDTDKLITYANNARTHSKEQILKLRSSLREFGFINPIIIDKDFNVIAGHGRLISAKEEHFEKVPCVMAEHLTEAQKKAYILADNRMALDSEWDEELLAIEMEELHNLGFDLNLTGFDESEIADLFDVDSNEVKEDDFDVDSELEKPCFSESGDIWHIGKHTVICGDSTLPETYTALLGDTKDGRHIWYGDQKQKTVFEFDRIKNSKEDGCGHPSSKPVPLIAYLISQCTQTNGTVLDGFLGSASTLIACEQLNRICYGIELEPKFVDVAVKRYIALKDGNSGDIYVIRNGQKLPYTELCAE